MTLRVTVVSLFVSLSIVVSGAKFDAETISHFLNLDLGTTYQTMNHAGAAITESVAIILMQYMQKEERTTFLQKVFAPIETATTMRAGKLVTTTKLKAHLTAIRLTMGASDFNVNYYSYDDIPANASSQTDYDLQYFSVAKDEVTIIPLLKEIKAINPNIKILATPWSAPGWMKDSGTILGGSFIGDPNACEEPSFMQDLSIRRLRSVDDSDACKIFQAYANYFVKFVEAYFVQHNLAIDVLTFQNEPLNSNPEMPSMLLSSAVEGPLGAAVAKGLRGLQQQYKGITLPRLFAYDHNWDNITYPENVLSTAAAPSSSAAAEPFSGAAFHCYGGDVSNQTNFHNAFANTEIWLTECTGGGWAPKWQDNLHWDAANLFIGNMQNWGTSSFLWNLVLTPEGGPKTGGGCMNCRGIFSYDKATGTISPTEDWFPLHNFAAAVNLESKSGNGGVTLRAQGTIDTRAYPQALSVTVNTPVSNNQNKVTYMAMQLNLESSWCSSAGIQIPFVFSITLPSGKICKPLATDGSGRTQNLKVLCPSVSATVFALTDPLERWVMVQLDQSFVTYNQTLADLRFDQTELMSDWQNFANWTCMV